MKATLVNIVKEDIELDGENPLQKSYKRFSLSGLVPFKKYKAGDIIPDIVPTQEVFLPVKVFNPDIMAEVVYLVRHDQTGMFNDLMEVRNGYLQNALRIVEDATTKKMMKKFSEEAVPELIKSIKVLPFWKRLFNRF